MPFPRALIFIYLQGKCKERCEKPRECMVLKKTGQVECACKPCPSILNMNNGGGLSAGLKVDLKQMVGGADMGQTICTESGASFPSLCELQYAECVNNQTFKITTDSLVCDIKSTTFDLNLIALMKVHITYVTHKVFFDNRIFGSN